MAVYSRGHICQCLRRIDAVRRDSPVAIAGARRRNGREFAEDVRSLARGLADSGIARGDVVAVAALNSDWYMVLFLAIAYIGGIVAPLNHRWSFEEANVAMEAVKPKMLAVDEYCSPWALQLQKSNNLTMDLIRSLAQDLPISDPIAAPDDVALICFTSGTTGKPKGVAISHTALIVQSLAKIAIVGYGANDVYLHTAPLCHIGGISSCMALLLVGGCHVLVSKFDARLTFEAIRDHQVTSFITVPAMMADLIAYGRKFKMSGSGASVSKVLNGGGGLLEEYIIGANQLFPHAKIFSAYGMTEACSSLTFMTLFDPILKEFRMFSHDKIYAKPALQLGGVCVGKPAPHVELKISGNISSSYGPYVGNILTRGLHVMVGYWNNMEVSASDSAGKGWLDTGDIGWLDGQGSLWLIGRTKGRIKTGGENVYPEEVEAVISQHPGISMVVVVGIPDIRLTERVVACLNIKDGWKWVDQKMKHPPDGKQVSPQILQDHCSRRNLSRFKIPKTYTLWEKPFPLTTTGKIRRDDVRKEILSLVQLQSNL